MKTVAVVLLVSIALLLLLSFFGIMFFVGIQLAADEEQHGEEHEPVEAVEHLENDTGSAPVPEELIVTIEEPEMDGTVTLTYVEAENEEYENVRAFLQEAELFDEEVAVFNDALHYPEDIGVYFQQCDEVNAFYDPDSNSILMCYEVIEEIATSFEELGGDDEEILWQTMDATLFVFYHEFGHGLVDVFELPITGREEDAVDQLATILLVETDSYESALNGALWFYLESEDEELEFWGEHSISEQRFYNILCWIHGSDTTVLDEEILAYLPEERRDYCEEEYAKVVRAWETLLKPYAAQ